MVEFAKLITNEDMRSKCIFPIGLATLFELQAMDDPLTIESLVEIVDKYSENLCIRSHFDIQRDEFKNFFRILKDSEKEIVNPFCFPSDINGPLAPDSIPDFTGMSENAIRKALYDITCSWPISVQLEMALQSGIQKWSNSEGIDESNVGKLKHQSDIKTFNDAIFVELAGIFSFYFDKNEKVDGRPAKREGAVLAIAHWFHNPDSMELASARVFANLHAVLRYTENRVFKDGDFADFSAAAAALPFCDAMFTDRRMMNIAKDHRSQIGKFIKCEMLFGFDKFAEYLKSVSNQSEPIDLF